MGILKSPPPRPRELPEVGFRCCELACLDGAEDVLSRHVTAPLRYLEQVLLDFPDLVVVAGHIGSWAETKSACVGFLAEAFQHEGVLRCPVVGGDAFPGRQVPKFVH